MRLLAGVLVLAVSACSVTVATNRTDPWPVQRTVASIAMVSIPSHEGLCTAFSINETEGYYITANHCLVGSDLLVDGMPAEIVDSNPAGDVAVVKGPPRMALLLGPRPSPGDTVIGLGIPANLDYALPVVGVVATTRGDIPANGAPTHLTILGNATWIVGMSGGPIVNRNGQVVSVVLCGAPRTSVYWPLACGAGYAATMHAFDQWGGE